MVMGRVFDIHSTFFYSRVCMYTRVLNKAPRYLGYIHNQRGELQVCDIYNYSTTNISKGFWCLLIFHCNNYQVIIHSNIKVALTQYWNKQKTLLLQGYKWQFIIINKKRQGKTRADTCKSFMEDLRERFI